MTSPTLERAARAAAACLIDAPVDEDFSLADVNGWTEDKAFEIARAVLMAVREPDEKLMEAMNAAAAFYVCLEHHAQTDARMWRAGVDAILNDGEGE